MAGNDNGMLMNRNPPPMIRGHEGGLANRETPPAMRDVDGLKMNLQTPPMPGTGMMMNRVQPAMPQNGILANRKPPPVVSDSSGAPAGMSRDGTHKPKIGKRNLPKPRQGLKPGEIKSLRELNTLSQNRSVRKV